MSCTNSKQTLSLVVNYLILPWPGAPLESFSPHYQRLRESMGVFKDYSVQVHSKEIVAAALPFQEHWLPLSNLDLLLPALDVGVLFCYKRPSRTFMSMARTLKASLAKTLVTYYPLAGEVVVTSVGEPELLCNNRGVDFIEAYADVELAELQLSDPDDSVEKKLVPKKKKGVLCVQATELKCGGVVVACTFDHRIADAYSMNMFLVSWAEITRDKHTTLSPSFRRSLLGPRRPSHHDPSLDRLYVPVSALPPPSTTVSAAGNHTINRIYFVSGDEIERMQAEASSGARRSTKLEAFSAYLWRVMAKAAGPDDKACRLGVVVDGRSRLAPNLMASYFGNVLSIPYATLEVGDLAAMGLPEVADALHECLKPAVTEEHFLNLVDWVELHRPEAAMTKIYSEEEGARPALVISSGQRFPVMKVDFGWGKPVFGSYHFPWDSSTGYVMPMPSASGDEGDWVVYMHLTKRMMEALEAMAGHVFLPLTLAHLDLSSSEEDTMGV